MSAVGYSLEAVTRRTAQPHDFPFAPVAVSHGFFQRRISPPLRLQRAISGVERELFGGFLKHFRSRVGLEDFLPNLNDLLTAGKHSHAVFYFRELCDDLIEDERVGIFLVEFNGDRAIDGFDFGHGEKC